MLPTGNGYCTPDAAWLYWKAGKSLRLSPCPWNTAFCCTCSYKHQTALIIIQSQLVLVLVVYMMFYSFQFVWKLFHNDYHLSMWTCFYYHNTTELYSFIFTLQFSEELGITILYKTSNYVFTQITISVITNWLKYFWIFSEKRCMPYRSKC
jgi:hypothetical protein